jgi:hypothetical protein
MWRYPKSDYKCSVMIQHIPTQKYLTIEPHHKNKITLQTQVHSDASIFQVYERRTPVNNKIKMIGLCNKCTRTWLGQSSILGSVACSAKKFGKNEEWELDDGMMDRTKILCAAANRGSGGWLNVDVGADDSGTRSNGTFTFGGYDAASKRSASLWSVVVLNE